MEQKLVQVERGNVVLRVPDYDVQRYIDQGYNLIDDKGNVIQASVPRSLGTLQQAFIQNQAEIARLKQELAQLSGKKTSGRKKKSDE